MKPSLSRARLAALMRSVLSAGLRAASHVHNRAPVVFPKAFPLLCVLLLLSGCIAPVGVETVSPRRAYAQLNANALRAGKLSSDTVAWLRQYNLDALAERRPDEAVRQLHAAAVTNSTRAILFSLAELSFYAGEQIGRSVKAWDERDARDYYLGSAVYAWLFLFGDGAEAKPSAFDPRFREACDFYNWGLGLALTERRSTNGVVRLGGGPRRLPVGEIRLRLGPEPMVQQCANYEQVLLADRFRVRGFSMRNREPGLGAALIGVEPGEPQLGVRRCAPMTVVLRGPASLTELSAGPPCPLELHSSFDDSAIEVNGAQVPLEVDLTTFRALTLNNSRVWHIGKLDFLAPGTHVANQLVLGQPFASDRIPVVLVHGTFSSPVTWAELANSLTADPVLRKRYQIWGYIYGSGNPLLESVADFRAALTEKVTELDPAGTNVALRHMVVIGHSQGGLLTKATAMDASDKLWRVYSTNRLENLNISESDKAEFRRYLFLEPLPFVSRVVFIATPHRGSYLASRFSRRLARRLVSLPSNIVSRSKNMFELMTGSEAAQFFHGAMPTSLDGMSPKNPGLLAMAEIPVSPDIKAHSIIPVLGGGDFHHGRDGVVTYESAHVDYVTSELVVRSKHSCLKQPQTIEEVRRILHEHLDSLTGEHSIRAQRN